MKNQALFSSKDKSKKLKCHLVQFLIGAEDSNDNSWAVAHNELPNMDLLCMFVV